MVTFVFRYIPAIELVKKNLAYLKTFKYIIFALIAIALNILSQKISLSLYAAKNSLYLAMAVGTLAGLLAKYILDKRYIFEDSNLDLMTNIKQFYFYSMTGVVTTVLFWTVELSFDHFFEAEFAKYVGAFIGLSIGYLLKYQLDKAFVFRRKA